MHKYSSAAALGSRSLSRLFSSLLLIGVLGAVLAPQAGAQTVVNPPKEQPAPKKWFETISLRGYAQARYNRLLETNPNLKCEQCDRSWGKDGGFFIRRMRLIFSGQVGKRVYFYVQPDLASNASSTSRG